MKIISILLVTTTLFLTNGCATITRGRTTAFTVTSDPTNANVRLSSGLTCTTPCSLEMPRKDGFVVTISKEGYKIVNTNIISSVANSGAASMAGNVVFGGLIGAGVDASTGAMNDLTPNPLHVVLESE